MSLTGNTITGEGRNGIFGLGFEDLEISGNILTDFDETIAEGTNINLFNLPSGDSSVTLGENPGGVVNNAGGSGVTALQAEVGDPTDTPPDLIGNS